METPVPLFYRIRQSFPRPRVEDVGAAVRAELAGLLDPLQEKVRGGKRKRRAAYSARALEEFQRWADAVRPGPGDRTLAST